jgi:hypothetical protein
VFYREDFSSGITLFTITSFVRLASERREMACGLLFYYFRIDLIRPACST